MATLFSQNALNRLRKRAARFATHTVRAVLLVPTVIGIFTVKVTQAAPLQLTVLFRTNDAATGSGGGLGRADGTFSWAPPNVSPNIQFGPPVAASGGYIAFPAAAQFLNPNGTIRSINTGIWGGVGSAPTTLFIQAAPAPGLGTNTQPALMNVSELGRVAFYGNATLGDGLWSGDASGASPVELVRQTVFGAAQRPLQSANYIAFSSLGTNWIYDTDTKELRAVSYRGYPALVFGSSMTLSNAGNIVALTTDGRLLLQGDTSDGTNRVFLINKLGVVIPVMSQGDAAPGIPNRRMGVMITSGNDQGYVAVLVGRLDDGDANSFNDRSALFAGPATNVSLLAQSPVGVLWGGGVFISRSNYVYGANPSTNALGIYKLPASTNESATFTPLPPFPHPPRTGDRTFASLNALGQYAVLYANSGHPNQKNPGLDLWFYNPGEGWTNVARGSSNLVVGGETILVNAIGFVGNFNFPYTQAGGGYATGLADDGTLTFTINGTHIITTGAEAAHDFYWTGLLGPNWHTTNSNTPFTSWESVEKNPRKQPPGDAEPNTASVFINAFPGETVVLNQKPTPIGSLNMSNGLLRLQEHLTLNRFSKLHDVRMEAPNGSLTVNADASITNLFEWITGTVSGSGSLSASDVLLTNGTTTTLNSALNVLSNAVFDGGGKLMMSNAVLRTRGKFIAGTGTITNSSGASPVQNSGLLRKEGTGNFTIHPPFNAFEALLRVPPWGIEVDKGRLSLRGGGFFLGYHTNTVKTNATLELVGDFEVRGEEARFVGDGELEIGTTDDDCHLRLFSLSRTVFRLGGRTAHFNRGLIDGLGKLRNEGHFLWRRGTIAGDLGVNGEFINEGTLEIDSALEARSLGRNLTNNAKVVQEGTIQSSATIYNQSGSLSFGPVAPAEWKITRPADILAASAAAEFVNHGTFVVEPQSPGMANIDVIFETRGRNDPLVADPAVVCGKLDGPNPAFTLRFRGDLRNYDASERALTGGNWRVGPGCTMEFTGKVVEVVEERTSVFLNAGDMPSLELYENFGFVSFTNKSYLTPSSLLNFSGGLLRVSGSSVLTVNGNLENTGTLQCFAPAIIDVKGYAELNGRINLTGEIRSTGVMRVNGAIQASGVLRASSCVFVNEFIVGASPGVLNIVGSMMQTNTTVLVMELYGTATNQYDRLVVSSNAHLAGTLVVNLVDGFRPGAGDTFPVVQAGSITGQFANATNGQRIATIDGYGSVVVNYTPTGVVLSMFQLNPAPPPTARAMIRFPEFGLGDALNLALTGSPGRDYILQTTTNLSTNALDWISIRTNNAGFDGRLQFDLPSGGDPRRFFRALNR